MLRLGTVFSGIGSVEQALLRLNIPHKIIFACDNGDVELSLFDRQKQEEYNSLKTKVGKRTLTADEHKRLLELEQEEQDLVNGIQKETFCLADKFEKKKKIDLLYKTRSKCKNYVKETYIANYDCNDEKFHLDIRFLDGKDYCGDIDLLVGGSPCQSFSTVGAKRGLEDTRGTLFYEFARIIKDAKPKVFIYENVRGLTTHDNGKTWEIMHNVFQNDLHYKVSLPSVLNASDYGIPQVRRRLFVVGIRGDVNCNDFTYPAPVDLLFSLQDFLEDNCSFGNFTCAPDGSIQIKKVKGQPSEKFILTEKVRNYVLCSGTKNFRTSTKTDLPIARTLLKTMTQHHRAGVDNYITVSGSGDNRVLRSLTDREAVRLMGYPDSFKIVVSPAQTFRQAGNSIVVDVMMAVLKEIVRTHVFDNILK